MFIPALRTAFISALAPPFKLAVLNGLQALFAQNVGAWFRPAQAITMPWYQDSNGVTPVTAVEQPVGFAVDRSIGGVRGPELVTNGTFATDTAGWSSVSSTLSVVAGRLRITNTAPNGGAVQGEATIIGRTYICSADFSKSAVNGVLSVSNNAGGGGSFASVFGLATGPMSFLFVATAATTYVVPYINAGVAADFADFDNISVKLLDYNFSPVPAFRVNLLTKTEQLDDAVWSKALLTTVVDAQGTADKLIATAVAGNHFVVQPPVLPNSSAVTLSLSALAAGYNWVLLEFYTGTGFLYASVNVSTGAVGQVQAGITVSTPAMGADGLFRFSGSMNTAATGAPRATIFVANADGLAGASFTGDGTSGILVNKLQLEIGTVATRYQRVNTATDYDTAGFPNPAGGNHLTQPTAASRPVLSARVNLLTKTEQLDDAVWIKQAGITVTPNTTVAPDGTMTADTVTSTSTNAIAQLAQFSAVAGVLATAAVYVRANTPTTVTANFNGNANATNNGLGTTPFAVTTSWQRFTHSKAIGAADTGLYLLLSGIAGQDFQVWGAQLELVVSVPSRYQRVNTATDYDTAGFPSYTKLDGIDDSLSSATGGGGTAGFFFCAAVKIAGGAGLTRMMFSDDNVNRGFFVYASSLNAFGFKAGTGAADSYVPQHPTTIIVGKTYLVTAWYDGNTVSLDVNGVVSSAVAGAAAAGTTGFFIGKSNAAATDFFNGNIYEFVYARNTGLTPAQRLQAQRQVAAAAGIAL